MRVFIRTQLVESKTTTKYHWIVRTVIDGETREISPPIEAMDTALHYINKACSRWSNTPGVDSVDSNGLPYPITLKLEPKHGG